MSAGSETTTSGGSGSSISTSPPPPSVHRTGVNLDETAVGVDAASCGTARGGAFSMGSLPPDMPSGVNDLFPGGREQPFHYQLNTNAYDSAYEAQPLGAREDALGSSGSFYLDSKKDSYHPIKMRLSGGGSGGTSFMASFASGNRLTSAGEGGFLKPTVSLRSGSFASQSKTAETDAVDATGDDAVAKAGLRERYYYGETGSPPRQGSPTEGKMRFPQPILTPTHSGIASGQSAAGGAALSTTATTQERAKPRVTLLVDEHDGEDPRGRSSGTGSPHSRAALSRAPSPHEKAPLVSSLVSPLPPAVQHPRALPTQSSTAFATPRALVQSSSSASSSSLLSATSPPNVPHLQGPGSPPQAEPPGDKDQHTDDTMHGEPDEPDLPPPRKPAETGAPLPPTHEANPPPTTIPSPAEPNSTSTSTSSSSSSSSSSSNERRKGGPGSLEKATPARGRGGLPLFTPLIQQDDYRKTDIKDIACTADYTCENLVSRISLRLRPIRLAHLPRYEPVEGVREAMIASGRTSDGTDGRRRRRQRGKPDTHKTPRAVAVEDFSVSAVAYENLLLAVSLSLYGSVLYYEDIYRAATRHFLSRVKAPEPDDSDAGTAEESSSSTTDTRREDATNTEDGNGPISPSSSKRASVTLRGLLRWLNTLGVDVLVMTTDRRAASSFCAKRRHVEERKGSGAIHAKGPLPKQTGSSSPPPPDGDDGDGDDGGREEAQESPFISRALLRRVLVALEYDPVQKVWGPMAISRPIRTMARARHQNRKRQRRAAARQKRAIARKRREEAAAQAAAAKVAAKWAEWQAKQRAWEALDRADGALTDASCGGVTLPDTVAEGEGKEAGVQGEVMVHTGAADDDDGGKLLPFQGMLYPNIDQTDCGCGVVLAQSNHPQLGRIRVKLMVGAPLGLIATCIGVALIVYVSKTLDWCPYATALGQCLTAADAQEDQSGSGNVTCLSLMYETAFESSLANRFLFGKPAAAGNTLIVAVSCIFTAVFASVLFVFFVTRFLATGSVRGVFFHVMQVAHVLLAAIASAFSAYAVSVLNKPSHQLDCTYLNAVDEQLCSSRIATCGAEYSFHVFQSGRSHVALALAVVFLALCVLELIVALVPALPSPQLRRTLPTAQPQTYAFHPSQYAPDGMSPAQIAALQEELQPNLQRQLQKQTMERDRLLTRNITVGEMMQTNREQSLRRMELNKAKQATARVGHRGPGPGCAGGGVPGDGATTARILRRRRSVRYAVFAKQDGHRRRSGSSDDDDNVTMSDSEGEAHDLIDDVVLSPALLSSVRTINRRWRDRQISDTSREERTPAGASLQPAAAAAVPATPPSRTASHQRTSSSGRGTSERLLPHFPLPPVKRHDTATARELLSPPSFTTTLDAAHEQDGSHASSPVSTTPTGSFRQIQSFRRIRSQRSFRRVAGQASAGNPFATAGDRGKIERQKDVVLREKEPAISSIVERIRQKTQQDRSHQPQTE